MESWLQSIKYKSLNANRSFSNFFTRQLGMIRNESRRRSSSPIDTRMGILEFFDKHPGVGRGELAPVPAHKAPNALPLPKTDGIRQGYS